MSARPGPCGGRSAMIVPTAISSTPKRRMYGASLRERLLTEVTRSHSFADAKEKPPEASGVSLPSVEGQSPSGIRTLYLPKSNRSSTGPRAKAGR
jgi:hypothetical protein